MISDRTRTVIITVVTTIWALNFLGGMVLPNYDPAESINGIFMAIVGGLFIAGHRSSQNAPPPPAAPPAPEPPAVEKPADGGGTP